MKQRILLTSKDMKFIEEYMDEHFQRGHGYSCMLMMFLNEYKKANRRKTK